MTFGLKLQALDRQLAGTAYVLYVAYVPHAYRAPDEISSPCKKG